VPPYFQPGWLLFFLLFLGSLIWCWVTWLRSKPKSLHNWRAVSLVVGLIATTISTGLNVYLYVHASYTGGYPFYHPVEMACIRVGWLAALLGILAAGVGYGRSRIPVVVLSILNFLLWFMDALTQ
jgi:hypothetical protein